MSKIDRYPTDPPTAASSRKPVFDGDIFDYARMMSHLRAGNMQGCPPLKYPNDDLLVSTMIYAVDMPRAMAELLRENPSLRWEAIVLWVKVKEAAAGNKPAQEWVDTVREKMQIARRVGLVHDIPEHTIGMWER